MKKWALYSVSLIILLFALLAFIIFGLLWIGESDFSLGIKNGFAYSMGFGLLIGLGMGIVAILDKRVVFADGLSGSVAVGLATGFAAFHFFKWPAGLVAANLGFCSSGLVFCLFFTLSKLFGMCKKDRENYQTTKRNLEAIWNRESKKI